MNPVELHLPYSHSEEDLIAAFAREARIPLSRAAKYAILRKSIDARKKSQIRIVYQVTERSTLPALLGVAGQVMADKLVDIGDQHLGNDILGQAPSRSSGSARPRIVVAGAGPAGLFATLYLALAGCRPLLIERGQPVEQRQVDVARFWSGGAFDPESNVQFGEGGAGTFSDGKLTTGIRNPRCRAVLEELVLMGAPADILYLAKPHVGTDRLRAVVTALRHKIRLLGGNIYFGTRLTGLLTATDPDTGHQQRLRGIVVAQTESFELPVDALVLAVGHSARDTFRMLQQDGIRMEQKPFSVGVRIEHPQTLIDRSQYGQAAGHPNLPPAEYKLSCQLPDARTVYTFCMCPGGQVIASASADGEVVTNGMSHYSRDGENANSALLVPVGPDDFASDDPLAGMYFQQQIENKAYLAGGSNHRAPAQMVGDFLGSASSTTFLSPVNPTYSNGVTFTDLSAVLPSVVTDSLKAGLPILSRKLHGFADPGAILTGVETRSSSPVRILRDDAGQSSLAGLFPCGEGAGYAGGIVSAAVDGLRAAAFVLASRTGPLVGSPAPSDESAGAV